MHVLFLEPFDGGSHGTFLRVLTEGLRRAHGVGTTVLTLPGRHWKWRMRGAVPWLAQEHDAELRGEYDLVFAGSFLALAELVGLYPHLGAIPRLLYFHENQLVYPVRGEFTGERDHHYGFTQMVAALAATRCVFNSEYNRRSFLDAGAELIQQMPDARPTSWADRVAERSEVLGLPLELPELDDSALQDDPPAGRGAGPVVLWNHRWEHDKNPGEFFSVMAELAESGLPFRLIVCGEQFREVPPEMVRGRRRLDRLEGRILHWGYVPSRTGYLEQLGQSHLAVSTAHHEFFGVAALEATWMGARPVVPRRLCYPEFFPGTYCYDDLATTLRTLCEDWTAGGSDLRGDRRDVVDPHRAENVVPRYFDLFERLIR